MIIYKLMTIYNIMIIGKILTPFLIFFTYLFSVPFLLFFIAYLGVAGRGWGPSNGLQLISRRAFTARKAESFRSLKR